MKEWTLHLRHSFALKPKRMFDFEFFQNIKEDLPLDCTVGSDECIFFTHGCDSQLSQTLTNVMLVHWTEV